MDTTRKFTGRVRSGGNAIVVTVPKAIVESGIISIGSKYLFRAELIPQENAEESQ